MTIEKAKLWYEGKQLWYEYINVNGYSFKFTDEGIAKLSRLLDLRASYIKQRICIFLDNWKENPKFGHLMKQSQ